MIQTIAAIPRSSMSIRPAATAAASCEPPSVYPKAYTMQPHAIQSTMLTAKYALGSKPLTWYCAQRVR